MVLHLGLSFFVPFIVTYLRIIFSVLKSGGAAPFIEALPLVFGLDAAAATAGDHTDSNLLQLAGASDQLISGWFCKFLCSSERIFIHKG
jgi:hypothetical protein